MLRQSFALVVAAAPVVLAAAPDVLFAIPEAAHLPVLQPAVDAPSDSASHG